MTRRVVTIAACLLLSIAASAPAAVDVERLRSLPVLDRGRVKPIDTLARETVRSVTGKESFGTVRSAADGVQKIEARLDPLDMILAWQHATATWSDAPLLYVPHIELRKRVGLPEKSQWISPSALRADTGFHQWAVALMQRQQEAQRTRELARLTPVEDAAILLRHRLASFDAITSGRLIAVVPRPSDPTKAWSDLDGLAHAHASSHELLEGHTPGDGHDHGPAVPDVANGPQIVAAWRDLLGAYGEGNQAGFDASLAALDATVAPARSAAAVDERRVDLEVQYNRWRPFRAVWIGYLAAVALLVLSGVTGGRTMYRVAMGAFVLCIIGHCAAFALRCRITGWAPVTNMYETVTWTALTAAVLALVLELISRKRTIAVAGATTALIASVVADVMPPEMGRSIGTLAPVLRSNYWLTIHVLTIVSSYAAFALACVLGNLAIYRFALRRGEPTDVTARTVRLTYRSVQVGVLLIAAGTILGGLWADVSWGRFWGWDPKEVWALIVLLVYLALLHGRFAGRLGPFGFSAGAVAAFSTVLMSWYGVNFVLGAGLHSYGFNSGGQGYVASYVAIQLACVVVARVLHRRNVRGATVDRVAQRPRVEAELGPVSGVMVPQLDRSAGA